MLIMIMISLLVTPRMCSDGYTIRPKYTDDVPTEATIVLPDAKELTCGPNEIVAKDHHCITEMCTDGRLHNYFYYPECTVLCPIGVRRDCCICEWGYARQGGPKGVCEKISFTCTNGPTATTEKVPVEEAELIKPSDEIELRNETMKSIEIGTEEQNGNVEEMTNTEPTLKSLTTQVYNSDEGSPANEIPIFTNSWANGNETTSEEEEQSLPVGPEKSSSSSSEEITDVLVTPNTTIEQNTDADSQEVQDIRDESKEKIPKHSPDVNETRPSTTTEQYIYRSGDDITNSTALPQTVIPRGSTDFIHANEQAEETTQSIPISTSTEETLNLTLENFENDHGSQSGEEGVSTRRTSITGNGEDVGKTTTPLSDNISSTKSSNEATFNSDSTTDNIAVTNNVRSSTSETTRMEINERESEQDQTSQIPVDENGTSESESSEVKVMKSYPETSVPQDQPVHIPIPYMNPEETHSIPPYSSTGTPSSEIVADPPLETRDDPKDGEEGRTLSADSPPWDEDQREGNRPLKNITGKVPEPEHTSSEISQEVKDTHTNEEKAKSPTTNYNEGSEHSWEDQDKPRIQNEGSDHSWEDQDIEPRIQNEGSDHSWEDQDIEPRIQNEGSDHSWEDQDIEPRIQNEGSEHSWEDQDIEPRIQNEGSDHSWEDQDIEPRIQNEGSEHSWEDQDIEPRIQNEGSDHSWEDQDIEPRIQNEGSDHSWEDQDIEPRMQNEGSDHSWEDQDIEPRIQNEGSEHSWEDQDIEPSVVEASTTHPPTPETTKIQLPLTSENTPLPSLSTTSPNPDLKQQPRTESIEDKTTKFQTLSPQEDPSVTESYKKDQTEGTNAEIPFAAIPKCPHNEVYLECGSVCQPSCNCDSRQTCAQPCVSGCFCPPGHLRDVTGYCVTQCEPVTHAFWDSLKRLGGPIFETKV